MKQGLAVILLILVSTGSSAQHEIILLNNNWQFRKADSTNWYNATVPGTIHTDLFDNQLIGHPYSGNNEQKQQWIEKESWTYQTKFNLTEEQVNNQHIELVCEGLDTYAEIAINGVKIGNTTNMFRSYSYDLKKQLQLGSNTITIEFKSPLKVNRQKVLDSKYTLAAGNETQDLAVSPYTRKATYHFGWDFAPRFVTCGIWRPIYLRCWDKIRIKDVQITTDEVNDLRAIINLRIELDGEIANHGPYTLKCGQSMRMVHLLGDQSFLELKLQINNPKLWYPNGYGESYVYRMAVEISNKEGLLDGEEISFGIREIELIQEKDDIGTSFYFKVNDQKVFCKGANYVPQDMFLPNVKAVDYRRLLTQARDANMNMIRVWGGGIYENDLFYDLCDSLGLMVWQDFMFANSLYPNDIEFKHNVLEEIRENIVRLRNHPSLAIWCGNNEIEVAWTNWGWQEKYKYSPEDSTALWKNYNEIFNEMIPMELQRLDSARAYTSTSPLSNWGNPKGLNHGSMHYWGVWHGKRPLETYASNVGRFMVEYGFPSYPNLKTIEKYIDLEIAPDDNFQNRQKSYIGNGMITDNIIKYFEEFTDIKDWIAKSQAVQAHAQKLAIHAHRLKAGHCMGSLSWQLNDCWPGASWSLIDYEGKPKTAYFETKTQFLPLIIIPEVKDSMVVLTAVSDYTERKDFQLTLYFVDSTNLTYQSFVEDFSLDFLESKEILSVSVNSLNREFKPNSHFIQFSVKDIKSGEIISDDNFLFGKPAKRNIPIHKI